MSIGEVKRTAVYSSDPPPRRWFTVTFTLAAPPPCHCTRRRGTFIRVAGSVSLAIVSPLPSAIAARDVGDVNREWSGVARWRFRQLKRATSLLKPLKLVIAWDVSLKLSVDLHRCILIPGRSPAIIAVQLCRSCSLTRGKYVIGLLFRVEKGIWRRAEMSSCEQRDCLVLTSMIDMMSLV